LVSGISGRHDQLFVPGLSTIGVSPSLAGQSSTVALSEIDAGAAVIAFAIF